MNAKPTALDAYLARTAAIHAKLERLQQLADDNRSNGEKRSFRRPEDGILYRQTDGETPDLAESPASTGAAGKKKPNRLGLGFRIGGGGRRRHRIDVHCSKWQWRGLTRECGEMPRHHAGVSPTGRKSPWSSSPRLMYSSRH